MPEVMRRGGEEELRRCEKVVLDGLKWFEEFRLLTLLLLQDVANGREPTERVAKAWWETVAQAQKLFNQVSEVVRPRMEALRAASAGVAHLGREPAASASEAVARAIAPVTGVLPSMVVNAFLGEEGKAEEIPSPEEFEKIAAALPDAATVRAGVEIEWARLRAEKGSETLSEPVKLDELDKRIIELVRKDGPLLGKEIAAELDESHDNVRKHLGRLGDRHLRLLTNKRGKGYREVKS